MRGIAAKVCWGRAIGAYLCDEGITVTEVGTTLHGQTVLARRHAEVNEEGIGAALKKLLETQLTPRRRRRVPVCVGLGAERTFFATRRFTHEQQQDPSLDDLLVASGAAGVWDSSQTVADYVKLDKLKVAGGPVYSVVAARRELAEELFSALKEAGVKNSRLEPAPWSVLAATDRRAQSPRRWKLHVRILLQEGGGLAVLVADGQPLLWRRFTLAGQQAARMVGSAVRAVLVHAAVSLGIRKVDGVVLQGSGAGDLAGQISDDLGIEAAAVAGEGLTEDVCSHALALSAKRGEQKGCDLFGSLRPPPSIREIFPWKLATFVVTIAAGMALMLWDKSARTAAELEGSRRQSAAHKWARGQTTSAINKERKRLLANVTTVGKFLSTRIVWSDYLRDLPTRLPPNAYLSDITGLCELKDMSKKKQKRKANMALMLHGAARFPDRWRAPEEIDSFLEGLRNVKLLQRDFPRVQLAEIKWRKVRGFEMALFTIIALPRNRDMKR